MKGCKNLNSPQIGIWPHADYSKQSRSAEPLTNHNCFDTMGFPEQLKHYTDPLFSVPPFGQENGNSPLDNIFQVPENSKDIGAYNGTAGNYDDWDDLGGVMPNTNVNDAFEQPEFGFPEMDHFSVPEPIDQQESSRPN